MNKKSVLLIGFALFSLFFGAGNLILPPFLGLNAGESWWIVAIGFCLSAVFIPLLGLLAHAKLQGTLFDFGKKVSPTFSLVYCLLVYLISITLPSPRTASVTHEMAIQPIFNSSPWLTSILYFILVLIFVLNRSKILDVIGKLLTPAIILLLMAIIIEALFGFDFSFDPTQFENSFSAGILEGYQTFDAIGAVVVGGVIIISINLKFKDYSKADKKRLIIGGSLVAAFGLLLMYVGLILTGALTQTNFELDVTRTALLSGISKLTLGTTATLFLSILVSLACFTTAVGIVTGTADYIKGRFHDSQLAYKITAVIGCVLGVLMGQFDVGYIIAVALPALMFIYPVTIVLILLNVVPEKYASTAVFKAVVMATIIFSIPDFIGSLGYGNSILALQNLIPLSKFHLGWMIPALVTFIFSNAFYQVNTQENKL
ncbi:branched-chain amino acid transport system II carrier protein [Croceivirga thetidis]|uniref:Branched-chain amino acid transport system II carrier protein n=1 Tax=Croceivirga thetidis TaxID=2721623 RepID=A0ABX1GML9_9FLAO|nr:branched-chain amino acid transport system II carrier protein [Croceivirga thetidis]NKI31119.1 branched-chain amino acid transport system II carrier protein [Croceivirga thetidis]